MMPAKRNKSVSRSPSPTPKKQKLSPPSSREASPSSSSYQPKNPAGYEKYFTKNFRRKHLLNTPLPLQMDSTQLEREALAARDRRATHPREKNVSYTSTLGVGAAGMKTFKHAIKANKDAFLRGEKVPIPYPAGAEVVGVGLKENPRQITRERPSDIVLQMSTGKKDQKLNKKGYPRIGHLVGW